ncbi:MAG: glycosyltransferase family 4 protein [Pseudomonadota bacterium]
MRGGQTKRGRIAFYAPMKAPDHPVPSGDRTIARAIMAALSEAGFEVELVSRLRVLDTAGDPNSQASLMASAKGEVARITATLPDCAAFVTYHCHYRAPDLIGPAVSEALSLPYAIVEPSISPRRRDGPWRAFAEASEAAIAAAHRLFWTTGRDRPQLEAAGHAARMIALPPFLDPGPAPPPRGAMAGRALRLVTVAMMRSGDKLESYRRLARALRVYAGDAEGRDWVLTILGDGPLRGEVEALFAPFGTTLPGAVQFAGLATPDQIRAALEAADLMVWPGVGEGIGYAWLEAAAAALPVIAEDGPAARDVVSGILTAPGDARAFASAIQRAVVERDRLGDEARTRVVAQHSIAAAAATLSDALTPLMRAA